MTTPTPPPEPEIDAEALAYIESVLTHSDDRGARIKAREHLRALARQLAEAREFAKGHIKLAQQIECEATRESRRAATAMVSYEDVLDRAEQAESALAAVTKERDEAVARAERQRSALDKLQLKYNATKGTLFAERMKRADG